MSKTLYIKTLSPVFIGSGSNMEYFEYWHDGSILHRLYIDQIFGLILDKHTEAADLFSTWIEQSSSKIGKERDNAIQSQLRSQFTILDFVKTTLKDISLHNEIQKQLKADKLSAYSIDCRSLNGIEKKRGQRGRQGTEKEKGKKIIHLALKTGNNEIYLPGSSLKGAIRTALLGLAVNNADQQLLQNISRIIEQNVRLSGNSNRDKNHFADIVEHEVFGCGFTNEANERNPTPRYDDAKYDLMKLVSVTDTDTKKISESGHIAPIDLYQAGGETQTQTPAVEAINKEVEFQSRISFDVAFVLKAKQLLDENDNVFGIIKWIGFKKKFERLFGVKLSEFTKDNLPEMEGKVIQHILNACKNHALSTMNREKQWAEKRSKFNDTAAKNLMKFYEKQYVSPLLKIGYAGGFAATTILMEMNEHPNLKTLMKSILEKFEIGKPRNARPDFELDMERFPTSRRYETIIAFTYNAPNTAEPLGWLELSLQPFGANTDSLPAPQKEIQWLNEVKQSQKDIPAEVTNISRKPMKVKIFVTGHEGREYECSGVNNPPPVGTKILVEIKQMDKKSSKIMMLSFQRIFQ